MPVLKTVFWRRLDIAGAEVARLIQDAAGWILDGTVLLVSPVGPARLQYQVKCDLQWRTQGAIVQGLLGDRQVAIDIRSDGLGAWTFNREPAPAVAGCIDVDFGFTPSTNLLPIRRLSPAEGGSLSVKAAWLRFPTLAFEPLDQVYARTGSHNYRYESAGQRFTADLTVDDLGLVARYGDYWDTVVTPAT
jgi:hypothetical protein